MSDKWVVKSISRSPGVDNFRANHVSSFEAATEAEKEGSGQSTAFESVVNGEKAGGCKFISALCQAFALAGFFIIND